MDDYYGFSSFFAQVARKGAEDYREKIVFNRNSGEVNHPISDKPVPSTFLGDGPADVNGKDRREVVAEWLTSGENPYFATSIANRVWAHFMGVGNVEPVDDIRVSNPPVNPALFVKLGENLVDYEFDFKRLVRDICNSNAYQRSVATNQSNSHDNRNYSHALVRRIPAENLLDCITQITDQPDKFKGLPIGARAVQIADGSSSNYFLDTFGRSPRMTVCEGEATTQPSLSQALHLLNGNSVHNKIEQSKQVKTWMVDEQLSPSDVLNRIYVRSLSRPVTDAESQQLLSEMDDIESGQKQQEYLSDIYWAVLNSREFVFNH